ncbi:MULTISPECIES: hypothetical protein [unclassified Streptomyces]|uniref:hypothetical protein n=1 Tax=unclassified Streptomyces TaxID=2593676 RepID=UPI002E10839F|nr:MULTISPECIES: hypothetical protein [unclassified Streptomyces]WSR29005.1 hypothetical protein OG573_41145 [Streptomyces sp. NBC_01205]
MSEHEPGRPVPPPETPHAGDYEPTAFIAPPVGVVPSFPDADEARKWQGIEADHLAWRRQLVERQLRQERLDQWVGYGFRLLEYTIVIGFGLAFAWLGFYSVDHKASLQAVPLVSGGVAGLAGAVLAVRNKRG